MIQVGVGEVLSLVALIWLTIISFIFWKERHFLKAIFPGNGPEDVKGKLNQVLVAFEQSERRDQILNKKLKELAKEGLNYIQTVSVLRYNPYADTGGDQSFSIALLNGVGSGFVITSLHTRSGTRIYTKEIVNGKSQLKLSKEEQEVVKNAIYKQSI